MKASQHCSRIISIIAVSALQRVIILLLLAGLLRGASDAFADPPLEIDTFEITQAQLTVDVPLGGPVLVSLNGTVTLGASVATNGAAFDADGDGLDDVPVAIVAMNLRGSSPWGPVLVRLRDQILFPGAGLLEEQRNLVAGFLDLPPFTSTGKALSSLEVHIEAEISGTVLHTTERLSLQAMVTHQPPAPGETFTNLVPADLIDASGNSTGIRLLQFALTPHPLPGLPTITKHPASQALLVGTNVVLSARASGLEPLSYQWTKNDSAIDDKTNAILALNNVQLSDSGNYALVVTNAIGSITSQVATLTIQASPVITQQPLSQIVTGGTTVTFAVFATGTLPLTYRWMKDATNLADGERISGAVAASLVISNVQAGDAGAYSVIITNSAGSTTSAVAILTIDNSPPLITGTSPTSGATNVSVATLIRATFNEQVDPGSLTVSSFLVRSASNTPVAGAITYDPATRTVTFAPAGSLRTRMTYIATITSDVRDVAGNRMANDYVWSFMISRLLEPDIGNVILTSNDDQYTTKIPLPFIVNVYSRQYSSFWINNNGNVTFYPGGMSEYTSFAFPNNSGIVIIAPFFADVDTRDGLGNVYYKEYPDRVVITWDNVGYYQRHGDKRNTFQLVISSPTANGNIFAFSYDDMGWTTGDSSGGGGFGGNPARAGFDAGDGTNAVKFFEGNTQASLLDLAHQTYWYLSTGGPPRPNLPPVANAGPDQVLEQMTPAGAAAVLNGTGSTDDGLLRGLSYTWTLSGAILGVGPVITNVFPWGTNVVLLTVNDGQLTNSDAVNVTVRDTTPPDTLITSGPSENAWTNSRSVTLGWSGTDNGTYGSNLVFSYALDGGAQSPFVREFTHLFGSLTDGPHAVSVAARDQRGNTDLTPAIRHFNVDATPPVLSNIVSNPGLVQCSIMWETTEAARSQVEYGLSTNYGSSTPLTSPFITSHSITLSGLTPGTINHFRIHVWDNLGNEGISEDMSFTTIPDTTPPETTLASVPATVCVLPLVFSWSGTDNVTPPAELLFAYRLDGLAWSGFSGSFALTNAQLSEGAHVFEVKARDFAGNEDPTPASRAFTVDTASPVFSNLVVTPDVTQSTVRWDTDEPATGRIEYGLTTNYGTMTPLQGSLITAHQVAIGSLTPVTTYHFRIRSQDGCGHELVSLDQQFTTLPDTTPPQTTLATVPANVCSLPYTFSWSGSDDVTAPAALQFAYRFDGDAWSVFSAAASLTATQLADGLHTIEVKARDAAGNEDPTPASRSFTIDTGVPSLSNLVIVPAVTQCQVTWSTDEPATARVEYGQTTNYGSMTPLQGSLTLAHQVVVTGLSPNTAYHFRVRSQDGCGHELVSSDQQFTTLPDTAPPETTLAGIPSTICSLPYAFSWSGTDDVTPPAALMFSYRLDGGLWSDFTTATSVTSTQLTDGAHSVEVKARDAAGNEDPTPASRSFALDTIAPTLSNIVVSAAVTQCDVRWYTGEPATARVEYGLTTNYGSLTPLQGSLLLPHQVVFGVLAPSTTYHFRVRSQDACGHEALSPDGVFITLPDTTPPDTTLAGMPTTVCTLPFTPSLSGSDDVTPAGSLTFSYRLDGQEWSAFSSATSITFPTLAEGSHTIEAKSRDGTGNVDPTPASRAFTVDTTPPVVSNLVTMPAAGQCQVRWNTDEPATARVEYGLSTNLGSTTSLLAGLSNAHQVVVAGLVPNNTYYFQVRSQDGCGHEQISPNQQFTTLPDTTPPDTSLVGTSNTACALPWTIFWNGTDDATPPGSLQFSYRLDGQAWSAFSAATSTTYPQLGEGSHTFEVKARDTAGNEDPMPASRSFVVDTTAPAISGVSASPGPNRSAIQWRTDEPSNGRVEYGTTASYGQSSALVTQPTTNHTLNLSGLQATTTYHYRVVSQDGCGHTAASGDYQFTTQPAPDLRVLSVSMPPETWTGSEFDVSWVMTNAGQNVATGPWADRVYLSADEQFQSGQDQLLGEFLFDGNLAAGQSMERVQSVAINRSGLTNGPYHILVVADATDAVFEGLSETNNLGVSASNINVRLTPLPDLIAEVLDTATNVIGGQTITIDWLACNQGQGATDSPLWYDSVRLYRDANRTELVKDYGRVINGSYLAPGECYASSVDITLPTGISGWHYLFVMTDGSGDVPEENENNNWSSNAVYVTYVPPPYLHIESIVTTPAPPTTVWAGDLLTITWTVRNTGGSPIAAGRGWFHSVGIGSSQLGWGVCGQSGPLMPGASYTCTATVTVPENLLGTNIAFVMIDPNNRIADIARDQGLAPIVVAPPPPSDLEVMVVTAPERAFTGDTINVQWTTANNGANSTRGNWWTDAVYLSPDAQLNLGASRLLGTVNHWGALAIGADYPQSLNLTVPTNLTGAYYVFVYTDIGNQIYEGPWETNNYMSAALPILITNRPPVSLPDLQVTQVSGPYAAVGGQNVTVAWTVGNSGSGTATAPSWKDSIYLSADTVFNPAHDALLGSIVHTNPLPAGGSYEVKQLMKVPNCMFGQFYLLAVADVDNQVAEEREGGDNVRCSATTLTIMPGKGPRLQVAGVQAPATATAGGALELSWTVENNGGSAAKAPWTDLVYLSADDQLNPSSDLLFGMVRHQNDLLGGYTYTAGCTNGIPRCFQGPYFVFVVTDASNQVNVATCETNNTGRSEAAISISPSQYANLQVLDVQAPPMIPAGASVNVSWVVTNAGSAQAQGTWHDAVYLSNVSGVSTSAVLLGSVPRLGSVSPGGSYAQSALVAVPQCLSGAFYLCVVADQDNQVNSGACVIDNVRCVATQVTRNNADLLFTEVLKPQTVFGGAPFAVSWTVANNGTVPTAGSWKDTVYLSTNIQLNRLSATVIASVDHASALAPGASYTQTAQVTLPQDLAGAFYVIFETDSSNAIEECQGEANNIAPSPLPLEVYPAIFPDLRVTGIAAPADASAGQLVSVAWRVSNVGNLPTPSTVWYDALYLSKDQVLDKVTDLKLGAYPRPKSLSIGETYAQTAPITIPRSASGPYYLFVVTDSAGAIPEYAGEYDNISQSTNAIIVSLGLPADLVVAGVGVTPNSGFPDGVVTVNWTVANQATNEAVGQWTDAVYLSPTQTWDSSAVLVGWKDHTGGLAASGSYGQSLSVPMPALTPNRYYALVRTDIRNNVREAVETNNMRASGLFVQMDVPELVLGVVRTNNLSSATEHHYKVHLSAGETLSVALDSTSISSANELYVRFGEVPDLGHYDYSYNKPLEPDQRITVPTTQEGWYYILVRGVNVPDAPASYALKAETIPFAINTAYPGRIGDKGQVTLTIEGARFEQGASVELVGQNARLAAAVVLVKDSATAKARFMFNLVPHGQYDVVLRNPGGTSTTKTQAIIIEAATGFETALVAGGTRTPRAGARWDVPCTLINNGNVDVPYVTISAEINARVRMGWSRPGPSLPRQSDYPGTDWLNNSPTAKYVDTMTSDGFWLRDVEAGQEVSFVWRVNDVPAGPFVFNISSRGRTRDEMASYLVIYAELLRRYALQVVPTSIPADRLTLVSDAEMWRNYYRTVFMLGGLVSGDEAGWIANDQSDWSKCDGVLGCFFKAAEEAVVCHFGCSTTPSNSTPSEMLCAMKTIAFMWQCSRIYCDLLPSIDQPQSRPDSLLNLALNAFGSPTNQTNSSGGGEGLAGGGGGDGGGGGGKGDGDCGGNGEGGRGCDPNEKHQTPGYGASFAVNASDPMSYTIFFENLPTASAFARRVVVVDQFDPLLDIRTFRVKEIAFNEYVVLAPENRSTYQTRVPLGPALGSNIVADISAGLDFKTGQAVWTVTAIDLTTGEPPIGVNQGVLPPNTTNHVGEGYVTFTIKPKHGVPTGTVITNRATIVFDSNEPIDTNPAWNTIDAGAPNSSVARLPAVALDSTFSVHWSGQDDAGGSGIRDFDIYVSENGGPQVLWQKGLTNDIATFTGVPGQLYRFYSIARDNVGNSEAAPAVADAETLISTNVAPVLLAIDVQSLFFGRRMQITNSVSDANGTGQRFTFGLDEAPFGAAINLTNGIISWIPQQWQASTTNVFTVRVTDDGNPPLSASQSFLVVVGDYVGTAFSTEAAYSGDQVCLPLVLTSSASLTNLSLIIMISPDRLTNPRVVATTPDLNARLRVIDPSHSLVTLDAVPESVMRGTQNLAEICFNVVSNQITGVATVQVDDAVAFKADGSVLTNVSAQAGRVIVVAESSFLEASPAGQDTILLSMYGQLGTTYQMQTSVGVGGPWSIASSSFTFSNIVQRSFWTNCTDSSTRFFRLVKP